MSPVAFLLILTWWSAGNMEMIQVELPTEAACHETARDLIENGGVDKDTAQYECRPPELDNLHN